MSVKNIYDQWAKYYSEDQDTIFLFDLEKQCVINMLNLHKNNKFLDIWCGIGKYIPLVLKRTQNIICSDLSKEMIKIISSKYPTIQCIQSDLTKKLPFKGWSFDKILCTQTIKHIKNISSTFKEIHRILRKNGEFVFTVIHPEANWEWYMLKHKNENKVEWDCYITRHTLWEILNAINDANMELIWMQQMTVWKEVRELLTNNSYKTLQWKPLVLSIKVRRK